MSEGRTAYIGMGCICMTEKSPPLIWHHLPPHNSIEVAKNEVYYGC